MKSATLIDGTVVETIYDVDGNRVRSALTPPGGPTTSIDYLVHTDGPLSHVIADILDGTVQTLYTRTDHQLIGLYRPASDTARYYHADGLGSIRVLSDESGSVTDRYSYTAFGQQTEHDGPDPQPYRFAGEPFDPNLGFYYNRARWLDVTTGRFVGMDPFLGATSDPQSLHRYLYTNNPVSYVDPSGLSGYDVVSLSQIGTMLGVLAVGTIVGTALDHFLEITITLGLVRLGLAEEELAKSIAFSTVFVAGFLWPDPSDIAKLRHVGKLNSKVSAFENSFRQIYPNGFRRKVPGTNNVAIVQWGWARKAKGQGMKHFLHRHVPGYWAGYFKPVNTQFPLGTSGTDVLRFIDEGIKIQGRRLKRGPNDIDYGDGRKAKMWIDDNFNITGFFPEQRPSSFEMKGRYAALGLATR